jgi:hypothetical protein
MILSKPINDITWNGYRSFLLITKIRKSISALWSPVKSATNSLTDKRQGCRGLPSRDISDGLAQNGSSVTPKADKVRTF